MRNGGEEKIKLPDYYCLIKQIWLLSEESNKTVIVSLPASSSVCKYASRGLLGGGEGSGGTFFLTFFSSRGRDFSAKGFSRSEDWCLFSSENRQVWSPTLYLFCWLFLQSRINAEIVFFLQTHNQCFYHAVFLGPHSFTE